MIAFDLDRFLRAQEGVYERAIGELVGPSQPAAAEASRRRPGFLRLFTS